jgi:subtilisin family serine protease
MSPRSWIPRLALALCAATPALSGAWSLTCPADPAATAATIAAARAWEPGAERRVWVFFTDKQLFDDAAYDRALGDFAARLDAHAAARRAKALGAARADFHDLDVPAVYVDALERSGASVVRVSRWLNAASVRASAPTLESIAGLPFVARLVPVGGGGSAPLVRSAAPESPPAPRDVFDYGPSFGQLDEIDVTDLHAAGLSGAGVIVAMLDTGYDRTHPAFARAFAEGRVLAQWDFINDDGETMNEPGDSPSQHIHGTATWSILGGFDEGQLIGASWGASFLLAKTEDVTGETPIEEDNWVAAMEWADALGADVISSSLSYIDWYTYEDMDGDTAITTIGADVAASRGIVVCNSAGNQGTQDWYYIGAPADADMILAIGGTLPNGDLWDDSSHGPTYDGRIKPEVCARGEGTYCAWPVDAGGPYIDAGGTSVACPLVAGSAALILQAHATWTVAQVRLALMLTADQAGTPDNDRGWGRIHAFAAAGSLADAPGGGVAAGGPRGAGTIQVWPNPARGAIVRVAFDARAAEIHAIDGRLVRRLDGWRAGARAIARWDGRDADGRAVAPGVYVVSAGDARPVKLVLEP